MNYFITCWIEYSNIIDGHSMRYSTLHTAQSAHFYSALCVRANGQHAFQCLIMLINMFTSMDRHYYFRRPKTIWLLSAFMTFNVILYGDVLKRPTNRFSFWCLIYALIWYASGCTTYMAYLFIQMQNSSLSFTNRTV